MRLIKYSKESGTCVQVDVEYEGNVVMEYESLFDDAFALAESFVQGYYLAIGKNIFDEIEVEERWVGS